MNPFQKNPFVKNNNTQIKGYNQEFQEKNKIEQIKQNMNNIKIKPMEKQENQRPQMTVSEKIEALRNINDR